MAFRPGIVPLSCAGRLKILATDARMVSLCGTRRSQYFGQFCFEYKIGWKSLVIILISKMRQLYFPSMVRQKLHHERKIRGLRYPSPFALKPCRRVNGLGLKHLANQVNYCQLENQGASGLFCTQGKTVRSIEGYSWLKNTATPKIALILI